MRFLTRVLSLLTILLLVAVVASGCKRQRAENSLKKTKTKLVDVEVNYNGNAYEPEAQQLQAIQQKVDQAYNTLAADAGAALDLAKQASTEADQLLENVKPKHGQAIFTAAELEIRVADINDLPRREPDRYTRIRDLKVQADTAKIDNKWDEVIQFGNQIISEVQTGLATLKNDSDRQRIDAEQALTNLTKIGGKEYTPEIVIAVRTNIDLASQISDKDRDYVLAAVRFQEAKNQAEQGIIQVLREKSREQIEKIEGFITSALIEGAKQFRNDEYQAVNRLYEGLLADYKEGRYSNVIEGSRTLLERSQRLVIDTKRAASDDRIQTMEANINLLREGGINDYIPNALVKMQEQLAAAREIRVQDTEEAFDRIKQISIDSADEFDRQRTAFQQKALDAIRDARNERETANTVFQEMANIYAPLEVDSLTGQLTPEQVTFESQKKARETELRRRLDEASSNLTNADLRQQQGDYRGAIILANEVAQQSRNILGEVYHTVAHNATIELARLISRYERDGARQYAPEELARSTAALEKVKASIAAGEHKRAVQEAAEARADVELMAQQIAGRATEDLREARRTLDSASSENTRRYRAAELQEVARLIEQAEVDLQEDRLKIALETAQRATALALQAEKEANQIAAQNLMEEAQTSIKRAQDAGAEIYAGRDVEDARRLLASAKGLYDAGEYMRAQEQAALSQQRAQNGLYKKINDAEAAIASATAVGGWTYDFDSLGQANTKVRNARAAMDAGRYSESASLADSARSTADGLTSSAKRHNFNEAVSRIRKNLDEGTQQGINFFQPEESKAIRIRLAELQNEYSEADYERVMNQVQELESSLRLTLDQTDGLVTEVADQLDGRLDKMEEGGAISYAGAEMAEARKSLQFARLDYRRGDYKAAHSNLDRAIGLVREVESRSAELAYSRQVQGLFDEYHQVQRAFANILSLDPNELKQLAIDTNGQTRPVTVSAQITPTEFRAKVDELYSRAVLLKAPASLTRLHESVIEAFSEGRMAAMEFEKLVVLNRAAVGEAGTLIDLAYLHMNNSNRQVSEIQSRLTAEEKRFNLVQAAEAGVVVNSFE